MGSERMEESWILFLTNASGVGAAAEVVKVAALERAGDD